MNRVPALLLVLMPALAAVANPEAGDLQLPSASGYQNGYEIGPARAFPGVANRGQWRDIRSARYFSMHRMGDGRYRVVLKYLAPDGNRRNYLLTGTREELQKQIGQSEALPLAVRRQLLGALKVQRAWPGPRFGAPRYFVQRNYWWRKRGRY